MARHPRLSHERWLKIISAFSRSRLTTAEFCRRNDIAEQIRKREG